MKVAKNRILTLLPAEARARSQPWLEDVQLAQGTGFHEPLEPIQFIQWQLSSIDKA